VGELDVSNLDTCDGILRLYIDTQTSSFPGRVEDFQLLCMSHPLLGCRQLLSK